jgi:serine/threonine protein kinase
MILYELVTGIHPFSYENEFFAIIEALKSKPFKELPEGVSSNMKELISKLLQKEIKDRPNINELMEKEEIKKHMI